MIQQTFDLVIVGGGPNGLYAFYKFRNLFPHWKIAVIEKEKSICAGIGHYPNVKWHSVMADLKLTAKINSYIGDEINPTSKEIANYYQEFVSIHQIPVKLNTELTSINQDVQKNNKGANKPLYSILELNSNGKRTKIVCRYSILATGISSGPRRLSIEHEKIHYGFSLSIKDKHLILVGGGNSAVDFITYLLPHNKITWVLRGEKCSNIFPEILSAFDSVCDFYGSNLRVINNATISKSCDDRTLLLSNGIKLKDFDACHVLIGYSPRNALNDALGLKFFGECLVLSKEFETSYPNIFAFGSLMATLDESTGLSSPTFVNNGNDEKLQLIVDAISRREVEQIFGHPKFVAEEKHLDVSQRFNKSIAFGRRLVKNLTLRHYFKTVLIALVRIESRVNSYRSKG